MLFLIQLREAAKELPPSTSRPHMKKRFMKRDREAAHERSYKYYFTKDSVYNEHHFQIFRM